MAAAETKKDREQRNTAFILEIEEKKKDREQRKKMQQKTESIKRKLPKALN